MNYNYESKLETNVTRKDFQLCSLKFIYDMCGFEINLTNVCECKSDNFMVCIQ